MSHAARRKSINISVCVILHGSSAGGTRGAAGPLLRSALVLCVYCISVVFNKILKLHNGVVRLTPIYPYTGITILTDQKGSKSILLGMPLRICQKKIYSR